MAFEWEDPPQMSSAKRSVPKTDAGGGKLALERSEKSAPSGTVSDAEHAGRKMLWEGRRKQVQAEMLRNKCQRDKGVTAKAYQAPPRGAL